MGWSPVWASCFTGCLVDRPEEVATSSVLEEAWFIAAQWQKEQCLGLWQRVSWA